MLKRRETYFPSIFRLLNDHVKSLRLQQPITKFMQTYSAVVTDNHLVFILAAAVLVNVMELEEQHKQKILTKKYLYISCKKC